MKFFNLKILLFFSFFLFFGFAKDFKVTLKIQNIKINKNKKKKNFIYISINTNEKNYLKSSKAKKALPKNIFRAIAIEVTNKQHQLEIILPKGKYLISCFNDKNNNKKIDTLFGFPQEQYGFANFNDKTILSQPKFKDLALEVVSQTNYVMKLY